MHEKTEFRQLSDLRTENVLIDKDNGDLLALIDWQVSYNPH